jgi:hypothetical protein
MLWILSYPATRVSPRNAYLHSRMRLPRWHRTWSPLPFSDIEAVAWRTWVDITAVDVSPYLFATSQRRARYGERRRGS